MGYLFRCPLRPFTVQSSVKVRASVEIGKGVRKSCVGGCSILLLASPTPTVDLHMKHAYHY